MANLRAARRNLYAIGAILLLVDIAAAVVLLSPAGTASAAREFEFNELRRQVQTKARTVIPPDQLQQRIDEARKQIGQFVQDRIPSESSALSMEFSKLASESGVRVNNIRYQPVESDIDGLRRFTIAATITGEYLQAVKFVNALERSKSFFVIDSVSLAEEQTGTLRLGLNLDTYLKETP